MGTKKAARQDDIPIKILKLNNDIFSQYLSQIFNESIEVGNFLNELRYTYIILVYHNRHEKDTKHLNVGFIIKSIKTLTVHCLGIRWATERVTALNIN